MTTKFQERVIAAFGESTTINLNRLGDDQWSILDTMCEKGGWSRGSGWTWSNRSSTIKLADSLVKRGLLFREDSLNSHNRPEPRFTPNPDIAEIWRAVRRERDVENHARWADQRREQELAHQQRRAHDFAVAQLIDYQQVKYDAWVAQYKAENPVEA